MKLELKTEKDYSSKSHFSLFIAFFSFFLIVIFSFVFLKLDIISRHYDVNFQCRLLTIEKSPSTFKKLSKLSKLSSKQKIWEFCREITQ